MRNVKVTYIPENATSEVVATLVDVVRVQENIHSSYLNIEIDDTNRNNKMDVLAPIIGSTITKIELLNKDNTVDITFTSYVNLKPVNRIYYDSDREDKTYNDNKLNLTFTQIYNK